MTILHKTAAVAVATMLSVSASFAATVTIDAVAGTWGNVTNNVDGTATGISGVGTDTISWGDPANAAQQQSSYVFSGVAPPSVSVSPGTDFTLGTFTHNNYAVYPPSLASADLSVSIDVMGYGTVNSVFSFVHEETPNVYGTCAYPSVTPCADLVTATFNAGASETIMIDGTKYVFDIVGFQYGGSTLTSFYTQENQTNTAQLIGRLSMAPIPLPASGLLLLGALGGFGAFRSIRRKKTAA